MERRRPERGTAGYLPRPLFWAIYLTGGAALLWFFSWVAYDLLSLFYGG